MNKQVQQLADQAVFQLQFNTRDAVKYICRNAGVDAATAERAVKQTATFHKA